MHISYLPSVPEYEVPKVLTNSERKFVHNFVYTANYMEPTSIWADWSAGDGYDVVEDMEYIDYIFQIAGCLDAKL